MIQSTDPTFKNNLDKGRHGWIRLTPAYSITLVEGVVKNLGDLDSQYILDPFSGSGTTGLVCAQNGIPCDLYEINPFLAWLSKVKTSRYTKEQLGLTLAASSRAVTRTLDSADERLWIPTIHQITKWWSPTILKVIAKTYRSISEEAKNDQSVSDLLRIAFCKLLITWSNAAFNHQSMSFKKDREARLSENRAKYQILNSYETIVRKIVADASENPRAKVNVFIHNSKSMPIGVERKYSSVITSPPYTNRISYIREVRPYMYWLGFINNARQAAELDWNATGGTWGIATSRLLNWRPKGFFRDDNSFLQIVKKIHAKSPLLANYVHRYFEDMCLHFSSLRTVLRSGAQVYYVIGNSKFYDVIVPTEKIYVDLLERLGFDDVNITEIRKRSSKKELYEYCVSATWKR